MTQQRLYQIANNAKGLCGACSSPLHPGSKAFCWKHLIQRRTKARKALGCTPGYKSGRGRKAITRMPQPQSDLEKAA